MRSGHIVQSRRLCQARFGRALCTLYWHWGSKASARSRVVPIVAQTERLCQGIGRAATEAGVPIYQIRVGTMFCTYFTEGPVTDYVSAETSDAEAFGRFFQAMLHAASIWHHRNSRLVSPAQPTGTM